MFPCMVEMLKNFGQVFSPGKVLEKSVSLCYDTGVNDVEIVNNNRIALSHRVSERREPAEPIFFIRRKQQ